MAAGRGIPGLDGAMRGLLAARDAILKAIVAINTDMKSLERSSAACRRLMTIPGVGRLTALAFVAAIDDPDRFRRSRDVGAYLGLVPLAAPLSKASSSALIGGRVSNLSGLTYT